MRECTTSRTNDVTIENHVKQQKDIIIHKVLSLERFTIGNAKSSVPRYAYLIEAGKSRDWVHWKSTLTRLFTHKFTLHFLCEASHASHDLHEVDGQQGVSVTRLTYWGAKLAPILHWSLKIAYVTAIAGSAILPGPMSGIASLLKMTSTAYSSAQVQQSASDSRAEMLGQSRPTLHRGEQQQLRGDARAAVKELLAPLTSQELKQQVGLRRVRILNPAHGDTDHVVWICDKCCREYGNGAEEI